MSARVAAVGRIEGGDHKATSWPWNLSGVLSAGLLYGLLHAGLRIELSANLPQDDVTANILAQTLEPGYVPRQPPLYEWLLWSVQRLTGPTLPSFLLIKYGLLTVTFGFLYLVATGCLPTANGRCSPRYRYSSSTRSAGICMRV